MSFASPQEEGSMEATELAPGHQQVQVEKLPDVPSLEPGQWLSNLPFFLLLKNTETSICRIFLR